MGNDSKGGGDQTPPLFPKMGLGDLTKVLLKLNEIPNEKLVSMLCLVMETGETGETCLNVSVLISPETAETFFPGSGADKLAVMIKALKERGH